MPKTLRDADVEALRRVLIRHHFGLDPDTLIDQCLCGWAGGTVMDSWVEHVAPLLADALRPAGGGGRR